MAVVTLSIQVILNFCTFFGEKLSRKKRNFSLEFYDAPSDLLMGRKNCLCIAFHEFPIALWKDLSVSMEMERNRPGIPISVL